MSTGNSGNVAKQSVGKTELANTPAKYLFRMLRNYVLENFGENNLL